MQDLAAKVDRLEAIEAIRQLASRYALAVDSRNMDDLARLFVEDVQVGRDRLGRDALKEHFIRVTRRFTTTVHFIGNHLIEFDDDDDHAHGIVYCRAEHEDGDHWVVDALQYWDTYARKKGEWLFVRRRVMTTYVADVLERPVGPQKVRWPGRLRERASLPAAWPAWKEFWARAGNQDPPMG